MAILYIHLDLMSLQILNAGKPWTQEEDALLLNLYNNDKLDVIQIAQIHQRAPGGIISRLVKNKIISEKKSARGYEAFLKLEDNKEKASTEKVSTEKNIESNIKKHKFSTKKFERKVIKKIISEPTNDQTIKIGETEFITDGNYLWEIKKVRGEIYGTINTQTNKPIPYSESTKKIINWLEKFKEQEIAIGYLGMDWALVQNYFGSSLKIINCDKNPNQKFDIIISNHFFDTNLTPEEKVSKLKSLNDNLLNFGELILAEQLNFYEAIIPFITNTKVIINETLTDSFFIRTIKRLNTVSMPLLVLDTETSGFPLSRDPKDFEKFNGARLIELGYIKFDKDGKELKKYDNLIKPDNFIITNSFVHGIKQEDALKTGKNVSDVLDDLTADLKQVDAIVCHNISFDMAIILAEAYRAKKTELIKLLESKTQLCSMAIGKKFMKMDKNPKLVELYKFLFNKEFVQDHRALSDCVACAECYYGMVGH